MNLLEDLSLEQLKNPIQEKWELKGVYEWCHSGRSGEEDSLPVATKAQVAAGQLDDVSCPVQSPLPTSPCIPAESLV